MKVWERATLAENLEGALTPSAEWRARAPSSAPCSDEAESIARAGPKCVQLIVPQMVLHKREQSRGACGRHCVAGVLRHRSLQSPEADER